MNKLLLNSDIQEFIQSHLNVDPTKTILSGSPFLNVKIQDIVEQVLSKKKCIKKLPTWYQTQNIYYPNKLNIEQTSSEVTAEFKSKLVFGESLIDLTGGFGVDSLYFSKEIKKVIHCEVNTELSEIVNHNLKQLRILNVQTVAQNGIEYLQKNKTNYDWIFADPSRRNENKKKVFLLKDCLPNIPNELDILFKYSDNILLKVSPILDIKATISELRHVHKIHIIAVNNEVKELLFILKKNHNNNIKIETVNIKNKITEYFKSEENKQDLPTFSLPKKYLYEPNAAVLKAGLFKEVSIQLKIDKLHVNSHLYTSDELVDFPGRRFKINHILPYDKKKLVNLIPAKKANITTRNFPQTVAQIRKKTGFKEGGDNYLFFSLNLNNKYIVLICEKV